MLALYSVVNIGFVAAELSTRAVSIHLRPAVASGVALASLFYWLCSQRVSRFVVRAFDGTDWGAWDSFNIFTVTNTAPVVTGSTVNLPQNHWVSLLPVLTYSDVNGTTKSW